MSLPPAQPAYILRGHVSQIHSTAFIRYNSRLVTADADGWIVIWSLATKRPTAVWRAHGAAVLAVRAWGSEKIITHGKDNKLIVWKLSEEDEESMSKVLPVETPLVPRREPWLLHVLYVNTMNFCSFAQWSLQRSDEELLLAVPNTLSSETVDIFHLPSSKRIHTVPNPPSLKGGMVMAVSIFEHAQTGLLTVVAGYESGHTTVSQFSELRWKPLYVSQAHAQPILSLDVSPAKDFYLTSSADAIIGKHPIPCAAENIIMAVEDMPLKTLQSRHSGQQGLVIRNDGKVFATAGWDSRVRVYSVKAFKELAVLKWHKEGCYSVAFSDVESESVIENDTAGESKDLVRREGAMTVREERLWKAKTAHWLAAGSKDGKVSLWDIY
ncbi:hypothetical protein LZ554_003169 [Drepanopeziza brunnea f. sp. 'monogermtubi']|nr:hypothetical protein LZ554_003169 [Drepanopeziza brunnea f. sp. 'monogermtubi']